MKLLKKLNKESSLLRVAFILSCIVHLLLGYLANELYYGDLKYVEGKELKKESPIIEVAIYSEVSQKDNISKDSKPKAKSSQFNQGIIKKKVEVKKIKEEELEETSQEVQSQKEISNYKKERPKIDIKKEKLLRKGIAENRVKDSGNKVLKNKVKVSNKNIEVGNKEIKNSLEEEMVEGAELKNKSFTDESSKKIEVEKKAKLIEDREVNKIKEGIKEDIKKENLTIIKTESKNSTKQEGLEEVVDKGKRDNKNIVDLTDKRSDKGVSTPTIIKYNQPIYPNKLRRRKIEGKVLLRVLIDDKGKVETVQVAKSSGYLEFDDTAKEVVKNWGFNPAKMDDVEVYSWVLIPISFRLD